MKKKYPFKFLNAYTREDADIFFGRTKEIEALYEMVFQTDLLLIYGASGTGKTSLIQCGLASRFESHDWMPLFIRRENNFNDSFERHLDKAGGILEKEEEDLSWLNDDFTSDKEVMEKTTLTPLARRLKAIYLKHFKPIYLIFDQFEELYILGNEEEQNTFIDIIKEILQIEQPVKVIISIREEYLGHLYKFERKVPELLRKKLRVEPMNLEKVKTVIEKVGNLPQSNVRLKVDETTQIAENIFEKIKGDEKTLNIQLPYLQVFLDKLYLQITEDETRQQEAIFSLSALKEIGNIGDVLRNFLDEQVLKIARQKRKNPEVLWNILSPFVTLEGTKEPLSLAQITGRLPHLSKPFINDCLQAFWKGRILRYNDQSAVYEIMHDSLAKQIHAKRSDEEITLLEVQRLVKSQAALNADAREYFSDKQLAFITPYEGKLNLDEVEKKYIENSKNIVEQRKKQKKRRIQLTIAAVIIALVTMALLTSWAWKEKEKANKAQKEAVIDKKRAERAEENSNANLILVEKMLMELEAQKDSTDIATKKGIKKDYEKTLRQIKIFIDSLNPEGAQISILTAKALLPKFDASKSDSSTLKRLVLSQHNLEVNLPKFLKHRTKARKAAEEERYLSALMFYKDALETEIKDIHLELDIYNTIKNGLDGYERYIKLHRRKGKGKGAGEQTARNGEEEARKFLKEAKALPFTNPAIQQQVNALRN